MSLRRQYVLVCVAFSILVSALWGGLAYRSASRTLEEELDRKLISVARAAADVGFSAELLLGLPPGAEDPLSRANRGREWANIPRSALDLHRSMSICFSQKRTRL